MVISVSASVDKMPKDVTRFSNDIDEEVDIQKEEKLVKPKGALTHLKDTWWDHGDRFLPRQHATVGVANQPLVKLSQPGIGGLANRAPVEP